MGRKRISRIIWAPAATIEQIRSELAAERSTESHANEQAAGAKRRERAQVEYVEDFRGAVLAFLGFHERHAGLADALGTAVVLVHRDHDLFTARFADRDGLLMADVRAPRPS